jgi:hypothetical protein
MDKVSRQLSGRHENLINPEVAIEQRCLFFKFVEIFLMTGASNH